MEHGSVLIVDDNPLIVNVLKSLLTSQEYEVHSCTNGEEALNELEKKAVDVIICDVMMPAMDGYQLHSAIRNRPELAHIPFVFLTALNDDAEIQRGKETGADDYLVKPFNPKELLSVVKGKLARSKNLKTQSEQQYENYRKKVIHTLSHEFRTPLVAINTGTELLLEQADQIDVATAENLLNAIQRGGQRLEKLVNDFMVLQQIEAGIANRLFDQRAEKRCLADVVKSLVENEGPWLEDERASVTLEVLNKPLPVKVYHPQIADLVKRLLENAVKFKKEDPEIEIVLFKQDRDAVVEIRDRGIGMDIVKVKEAMDVFGQIDREKLEQQGGGFGLAIANRFVEIHGGKLDLENRDGGGAVVQVQIPLYEEN